MSSNPLLFILASDGKTAYGLGRIGNGNSPEEAIRSLAQQVLKAGLNPDLPVRVARGDYEVVAVIPSLDEATKPLSFMLAAQLMPRQSAKEWKREPELFAPVTKSRTRRSRRGGAHSLALAA